MSQGGQGSAAYPGQPQQPAGQGVPGTPPPGAPTPGQAGPPPVPQQAQQPGVAQPMAPGYGNAAPGPAQPQGAPGAGYPGQPGQGASPYPPQQTPPQQGGYAFPPAAHGGPQAPAPYGRQVPGPPQPFPGGPAAPQFAGGPGTPGGPPRSGLPVPAILGIVAVALAVLGGGGYFLLAGGDSEEKPDRPANALQRLWEAPSPASAEQAEDENGMRSMWFNSDDLVFGDERGVRAYHRKSGKEAWKVKTPKGAGEVCALSKTASDDGVGAVVFDAGGDDCSYLSVVDTDTGRTLWSKNLSSDGAEEDKPQVVVNKNVVAVAIGRTYAGFSLAGGAKKWELTARGHICSNWVGLSPEHLAVSSDCSDAKPKQQLDLQDLEVTSIHAKIKGETAAVEKVLSDWPLTLLMDQDPGQPNPNRTIQTYSDTGKPNKSFALSGELRDLTFEPRSTFVDEDEQVMITGYGDGDGIAAMDLKTGKLLWKKRGEVATAGLDTEGAVAVTNSPDSGASARDPLLISINVRDGKEKVLGAVYDPDHQLPPPTSMSLFWHPRENTLYLQGESLNHDKTSIQAFKAPNG
ncbi:PQQ-binding-like beta-propeller repeat protein [Streptomyces sp. NPDC048611]|uniref:outer membrane protein assembly factor BamB family protein n=1 Tax=Streptomyces sp. NPDC048611 TaxID=3155635 RepID=UPI003441234E